MIGKTVLHVGSGRQTIKNMPQGFQDGSWSELRLDIEPAVEPDIIGSITDMSAVEEGSVTALYSSHNIEHVFSYEVVPTLREFRRVLSDDGFAVITCPDIQEVAKHVAAGNLAEPLYHSSMGPITALDIMFGHIGAVQRGEFYMAHRTGFSLDLLIARLNEAGFASVAGYRVQPFQLWAIATKSARSQADMLNLVKAYTTKPARS